MINYCVSFNFEFDSISKIHSFRTIGWLLKCYDLIWITNYVDRNFVSYIMRITCCRIKVHLDIIYCFNCLFYFLTKFDFRLFEKILSQQTTVKGTERIAAPVNIIYSYNFYFLFKTYSLYKYAHISSNNCYASICSWIINKRELSKRINRMMRFIHKEESYFL